MFELIDWVINKIDNFITTTNNKINFDTFYKNNKDSKYFQELKLVLGNDEEKFRRAMLDIMNNPNGSSVASSLIVVHKMETEEKQRKLKKQLQDEQILKELEEEDIQYKLQHC